MPMEIIEITADSMEEAEKLSRAQKTPDGYRWLRKEVISDVEWKVITGLADTVEEAADHAHHEIPPDAEILEEAVLHRPEVKKIEVKAADAESAKIKALKQSREGAIINDIRVGKPGQKGFLGLGPVNNLYDVEILERAEVKISYRTKAKIAIKVSSNRLCDEISDQETPTIIELSDEEKDILNISSDNPNNDNSRLLEKLANRVNELMASDRWEHAFRHWRILAHLTPQKASSWAMGGLSLMKMAEMKWREIGNQLELDEPQVDLDDNDTKQRIRKQLPIDDLVRAIPYLNRALRLDANDSFAWYIKALCLCQIGEMSADPSPIDFGMICFRNAINAQPNDETYKRDQMKYQNLLEELLLITPQTKIYLRVSA